MSTSICENRDPFLVRLLQQSDNVDPSKLQQLYENVNAQEGVSIERLVSQSGLMSERDVAEAYASHYLLPVFDPPAELPSPIDPSVASLLPYEFCREHQLVPLSDDGKTIEIAVCVPEALLLSEQVEAITTRRMRALFSPASVVERITQSLYASHPDIDRRVKEKAASNGEQAVGAFVIQVLRYAMDTGASDVHLEPQGDRTRVRLRIEGKLETYHASSYPPIRSVAQHIKSRSNMNVFDRLNPQAGFLKVRNGNQHAQFRVRTCPVGDGEKLVVRLLSQNQTPFALTELGFTNKQLNDVQEIISRPSGLILVGGPARSGKRTTMYSCLRTLNEATSNIYTIEDSINWKLDGAHQIRTQDEEGLDISKALNACAGQDADAVMVQGMPTPDVAATCAKMAMEGRLVFASILAKDSLSCISHLSELGVRPTSLAHSLRMVISQRLVRKLCGKCKTDQTIDAQQRRRWEFDHDQKIYQAVGCEQCRGTGYRGQRAIFEVLNIRSRVQHMIQMGEPVHAIGHKCLESGTELLMQQARQCVLSGETSLEEIQSLDASA